MLKYYNSMVVFEEIPNEITLAINITNCPCHCKGCHSMFLWDDVGTPLTTEELDKMIERNDGISTVCFMGGDREPQEVAKLARHLRETTNLKVGWYSGMDYYYYKDIDFNDFDYIKLGHYDEEKGGLDKPTTNQRMFRITHEELENGTKGRWFEDITYMFWK